MARQKGIIKLDGTIEDITFYKSKDGYLALTFQTLLLQIAHIHYSLL